MKTNDGPKVKKRHHSAESKAEGVCSSPLCEKSVRAAQLIRQLRRVQLHQLPLVDWIFFTLTVDVWSTADMPLYVEKKKNASLRGDHQSEAQIQ